MERQEVVDIFCAKHVILRSSVYSVAIARGNGHNRDAQSQTTKYKKEFIFYIIKQKLPMESKPLLSAWEPPLACLVWKMLMTDGREVNEKGACLKISFISVLKIELWHLYKSLLPSAKGISI